MKEKERQANERAAHIIHNIPTQAPTLDPIRFLSTQLNSTDPVIRRNAAAELGQYGGDEAVRILLARRSDPDQLLRGYVITALGSAGDLNVMPQLTQILHQDNDPYIRSVTIGALEAISLRNRSDTVSPEIIRYFNDRNKAVREAAARAVGILTTRETFQRLVDLSLPGVHETIRTTATRALGYCRESSSVEYLVRYASDDSPRIRREAVIALGRLGGRTALQTLCNRLLSDDEPENRWTIATAIGDVANNPAFSYLAMPFLVRGLSNDSDERVRRVIVRMLGQLGNVEAVSHLMNTLQQDASDLVRLEAGRVLAEAFHDSRVVPFLLNMYEGGLGRLTIVASLARLAMANGDQVATETVRRLSTSDPSELIRDQARRWLEEIQRTSNERRSAIPRRP